MTRVAPAALSILTQATIWRPTRSTASDGTVGDRRHRHLKSDHNPDRRGVVLASDLTHDPRHGVDAHGWIRWRVQRGDRRVRYAISNGQIWEPGRGWRRYTGENAHTKHVHVSVEQRFENDVSPWFDGWLFDQPKPPVYQAPVSDEEDDEVFYVRRKKDGAVWRLHGNSGRHMSPSALQFDQFIGAMGGKPIKVTDVDEAQWQAVAKNTTNSATGKAIL